MADVHPSAIVDPKAELADDVAIGPFCVVGPQVRLDRGVRLESHVVIEGRTSLGAGCRVFPFACLGHQPQDLKYAGEDTALVVGKNNQIREHATMHPGTVGGGGVTRVGDGCLFMAASHVAHDCQIGNGVIMANNASLGGHVEIGDRAILGGLAAVHQFVRIGAGAMVGGAAAVDGDVIPFGAVLGNRAYLNGLNIVGLKRRGVPREEIHALRAAYRLLFGDSGRFAERLAAAAQRYADVPQVMAIVDFLRHDASRAICLPRSSGRD